MAITRSAKIVLNGRKLEVDYTTSGSSSSPSYSPMYGACGGDDIEFSIETVTENDTEVTLTDKEYEIIYERLAETHVEETDYDYD